MNIARWIPTLVLALGSCGTSVSWSAAIVSVPFVEPQLSPFTVPVDISGVSDLYAFQFDLSYDPAVVHVTSITEGAFLPSGGATFFLPGSIDNAAGLVSMTADSLAGAVSGVSGSGHLAIVHFAVVETGSAVSPLTLSSITLLGSNLTDIPFSVSNGQVLIPEPWLGPLVWAALTLVFWLGRRGI
jgi:general secretion pathway protein D